MRRLRFPIPSLLILVFGASCSTFEREPHYSREILGKTERHVSQGEYEEALFLLRHSHASSSSSSQAARYYYLRGTAEGGLKKYDMARFDLQRALRIAKDQKLKAQIEMEIGKTYYRQEDFSAAEKHFLAALHLGPGLFEQDELFYKLAVCCQMQGRLEEGREYFERVNLYSPPSWDPLVYGEKPFPHEKGPEDFLQSKLSLSRMEKRIISRRAWGAKSLRSNFVPMEKIFRITLHHTGLEVTSKSLTETSRLIRNIQDYHQGAEWSGGRGWADIGYHFVVDRNGRIWEGRPITMQGAHAGSQESNRGNIGIAVLGNYDIQQLTAEQEEVLRELLNWLMGIYGIPPSRVYGHCDLKSTQCPGRNLRRFLINFRTSTNKALG